MRPCVPAALRYVDLRAWDQDGGVLRPARGIGTAGAAACARGQAGGCCGLRAGSGRRVLRPARGIRPAGAAAWRAGSAGGVRCSANVPPAGLRPASSFTSLRSAPHRPDPGNGSGCSGQEQPARPGPRVVGGPCSEVRRRPKAGGHSRKGPPTAIGPAPGPAPAAPFKVSASDSGRRITRPQASLDFRSTGCRPECSHPSSPA